ncbi:MAG: T9SS type A sorting domain-containing protein [Balneolaceae bacterium]|nr:T9SS type A sorting domain-containing protein [Balneolaceae bacterium]
MNNLWWGFGAGNTIAEFAGGEDQGHTRDYLSNAANGNMVADPQFAAIGRTDGGNGLNPVPATDGPAFTMDRMMMEDPFFTNVPFVGAFGSENWLRGWTALEEHGYLAAASAKTTVTVANADFVENTDYYWTADNTYILDDLVFIKPGSRLFIEPGTLIQGNTGDGNDATGLVITRGAKIYAEGTPSNPIVFTSIADQRDGTANSSLRGLWGGVVILGSASTNNATAGGVKLVEGVDQIANPVALAEYGGDNDADDSGVFRYVSIRHTGIQVGDIDGNEIQGLTLGGVGSGTTIEYVESFASNDDGFEFFGGTVNTKFLVSAFNTDDAFDWDEGFRGKGQFWFAIQDNGVADGYGRAAEQDGATGDENTTPFAKPVVSNVTYLGAGLDAGANAGDGSQLLLFRDNTGGEYYNSIFGDHAGLGITIEAAGKVANFDSKTRLAEGDLKLMNNLWWGFGAGNTIAEFAGGADQAHTRDYLSNAANGNMVADPELNGIDRSDAGMALDPRPNLNGMAYRMALKDMSGDDFFTATNYAGAFGPSLWIAGWTALEEHGYLRDGGVISPVEDVFERPVAISLDQNYPNPFNPSTNISFALPSTQKVTLKVYDMLGREVATLINNQTVSAGQQTVSFDASGLSSGVYIYQLVGANASITKRMTLIK